MNNYYEYIGYAGAFFISINLIPQIVHIYKNKNADSISTTSIILGIISSVLMLTYGTFILIYQYFPLNLKPEFFFYLYF